MLAQTDGTILEGVFVVPFPIVAAIVGVLFTIGLIYFAVRFSGKK